MNKAAKQASDLEADKALFQEVISRLHRVLEGKPFLRKNVHTTPQNQFEAALVAMAEIIRSGNEPITPPSEWVNDGELVRFSSLGTNSRPMLRGRINRAIELLSGKPATEILKSDPE